MRKTRDDLRNKGKVLWLPVDPRQQKHLAIAVLDPTQAHVEATEGRKETCGAAMCLHQFSLDQDLPTEGNAHMKQNKNLLHLITLNMFGISVATEYE